jgi:septal ring-binding cell division protein DamX
MPDLNLIDEGGFEETQAEPVAAPPTKKIVKRSSGGGGGKIILLLLLVLCIAAAGVYFLNQRGILKLWGKKQQPIVQMQEEQFPPEVPTQQPIQAQKQADTNEVALINTTPVEEKAEVGKESQSVKEPEAVKEPAAKAKKSIAKKSKAARRSEAAIETESVSKLSEMVGEFTVQVVAYREKNKALETAKNLEISGYPSFVEMVPMNGGDWYTVRIGRYPTRDEAEKAVQSFAEELQAHYIIDKVHSR